MWGGISVNASGRQLEMPDQVGHDGGIRSGMTEGAVVQDGRGGWQGGRSTPGTRVAPNGQIADT